MKDNRLKISIILITYNAEKFLERTVDSVLSQTFTDFELIIIDDGSYDKIKDIILKLANKNKKIKYVFLENNSGSPARPHNIVFNHSVGELYCLYRSRR